MTRDQEIRVEALRLSINMDNIGLQGPDQIIDMSKQFEEYIRGDEQTPSADTMIGSSKSGSIGEIIDNMFQNKYTPERDDCECAACQLRRATVNRIYDQAAMNTQNKNNPDLSTAAVGADGTLNRPNVSSGPLKSLKFHIPVYVHKDVESSTDGFFGIIKLEGTAIRQHTGFHKTLEAVQEFTVEWVKEYTMREFQGHLVESTINFSLQDELNQGN